MAQENKILVPGNQTLAELGTQAIPALLKYGVQPNTKLLDDYATILCILSRSEIR